MLLRLVPLNHVVLVARRTFYLVFISSGLKGRLPDEDTRLIQGIGVEFIVDLVGVDDFLAALQPHHLGVGFDTVDQVFAFFFVDLAVVVKGKLLLKRFLPPEFRLETVDSGYTFLVTLALTELLLLFDFVHQFSFLVLKLGQEVSVDGLLDLSEVVLLDGRQILVFALDV